ncbi:MAG TPA: hypothetical protein DCM36_09400 [Xanthomonadaceae bacterium]|nr:hypothetical protein [Xanthomonadaceae bacterium]
MRGLIQMLRQSGHNFKICMTAATPYIFMPPSKTAVTFMTFFRLRTSPLRRQSLFLLTFATWLRPNNSFKADGFAAA